MQAEKIENDFFSVFDSRFSAWCVPSVAALANREWSLNGIYGIINLKKK